MPPMPARRSWPGARATGPWTCHRPGPELAARRDRSWELADAQAEAKRLGRPARRFKEFLYATLDMVPQAPGRRQGRAPARQGQPALRGHLAARHLLGPDRLRARLLPEGQHGEHDQGAAARSLLRPDLGRRASPPTSSGSSSPPSPRSSSLRSGVRCTAPAWPAPPPERCGSSSSRSAPAYGLAAKGQLRPLELRTPVGGLHLRLRRRSRLQGEATPRQPFQPRVTGSGWSAGRDQTRGRGRRPATLAREGADRPQSAACFCSNRLNHEDVGPSTTAGPESPQPRDLPDGGRAQEHQQ